MDINNNVGLQIITTRSFVYTNVTVVNDYKTFISVQVCVGFHHQNKLQHPLVAKHVSYIVSSISSVAFWEDL